MKNEGMTRIRDAALVESPQLEFEIIELNEGSLEARSSNGEAGVTTKEAGGGLVPQ